MSEYFCCNKLCRCHVYMMSHAEYNRLTYREANGKDVYVRRIKIKDPTTEKEFDFCEICANAVALVNQK